MMNIKLLRKEINSFRFLTQGARFYDDTHIELNSPEEALAFLEKFAVAESTTGVPYTLEDLKRVYDKVHEMASKEPDHRIFSESLPLLPGKNKKDLDDVYYFVKGCSCHYERSCK